MKECVPVEAVVLSVAISWGVRYRESGPDGGWEKGCTRELIVVTIYKKPTNNFLFCY